MSIALAVTALLASLTILYIARLVDKHVTEVLALKRTIHITQPQYDELKQAMADLRADINSVSIDREIKRG